jgi:S-adenosylmethionine synthetase
MRNIVVEAGTSAGPADRDVEICEHKGLGHPDTITDAVCEAASRELSLAYRSAYGAILHHNVDKGLLVGGRSEPRFGGGRILAPAKVIIAGRATRVDAQVEPAATAIAAAKRHLTIDLGFPETSFQISADIGEGAANLKEIFARQGEIPLANDTSIGVGFAPYTALETLVLSTAGLITSPAFRRSFPSAGLDFKVMGLRNRDAVTLTIALAIIGRHIASVRDYFAQKDTIREHLAAHVPGGTTVQINTLDDPAAKDESGVYLTVSGTSAEMGDDGQVGRGNRASRLITPARPMSLEACAGKNPVSHVGKIYNVLAMTMAREIHERFPASRWVNVELLSAIGAPIDQPQMAAVTIGPAAALTAEVENSVRAMVDQRLHRITDVTDLVLAGRVSLF